MDGAAPRRRRGHRNDVGAQRLLTVTPDGSAQLVAIGDDGNVYHRIRNAAGGWSPFQPIAGAGGASTFSAPRVRIAALPDGSAQLLVTSC
ncbi:hypothetical protein ABT234_14130 [Streptomyces sp. NPDC001586]|uniref:hypothetical protein n=1 Tax=Streptomyces sp. NPDC001586 TaxID=3154387 RepID=UPI0033276E83